MLNQDFKEFIQSLNDNDVRYLVVGAMLLHYTVTHATRKTWTYVWK